MSLRLALVVSVVGFAGLFVACGPENGGPNDGWGGAAGWRPITGAGGAAGSPAAGTAGAGTAGATGTAGGGATGAAAAGTTGGGTTGAAGGAAGSAAGSAGRGGTAGAGTGAAGAGAGGTAGSSVAGAAGHGTGGIGGGGVTGQGSGGTGAAGMSGSGGSTGGTGGTVTFGPLTCTHGVIADFDGDGTPDCVVNVPTSSLPSSFSTLLGLSSAVFFLEGIGGGGYSQTGTLVTYIYSSAGYPETIGDMNGDGRADLLVWDYTSGSIGNTGVRVVYFKGQANGTFTIGGNASFTGLEAGYSISGSPVAVGDFNNDGNPDRLGVWWTHGDNSQAVYWMFVSDKGCTTVPAGVFIGAHGAVEQIAGPFDFNGDGNLDLVALVHTETLAGTTNTSNVAIIYGHGDGTFASSVDVPGTSGASSLVSVSDLNGDGNIDLEVDLMTSTSPVTLYGDGAGNFSTTPP